MEFKKFFVFPKFPEPIEKLVTISYNLWFTWDFDALNLFYQIDADLFRKVKHNPIKFIHHLPKEKIQELIEDKRFLLQLQDIWERFEEYKSKRHPLITEHGISKDDTIAYFCMEFAIHESLPIYAGGLGVLAGDILMGASDLDLPIVGVGLLYNKGYFKQVLDATGMQNEEDELLDKFLNIIREVRTEEGLPLIIDLHLHNGWHFKAKVWKVEIGKTVCLLLDTDIMENPPEVRGLLNRLYPAEPETRLKQEILLGMGGYLALKQMGFKPKIYHLNEGHSAFVILSRLKDLLAEGLMIDEARLLIKETTVFTTHTPVIAGNEHFDVELVKKYLEPEVTSLGLNVEEFIRCGCIFGDTKFFWLPVFAIKHANYVNAVSKLHQRTTKKMWSPLFQDYLLDEVPIDYVTNGVHWRWLSEPIYEVLRDHLGEEFKYLGPDDKDWEEIFNIPDEDLWDAHKKNKQKLVNLLNKILEEEVAKKEPLRGGEYAPVKRFPMIIGCARRITGYKRNTLILFDKERLLNLLKDTDRPIILAMAGKAHPKDVEGKKMVQEFIQFRDANKLYDRFFFIENYDLHISRYLVWGSDVWLNTPYRPMEASGTSGMKACLNGVLHLSVLDGWWLEGYNGKNGWAIQPKEGLPPYNYYEANQLYSLIEGEIRDLFYHRDEEGLPREWIKGMKYAIYTACKHFSINRALLEYLQKFYVPSLSNLQILSKNEFFYLKELAKKVRLLKENWAKVNFVRVYDNILSEELFEETTVDFTAEVDLANIPPELITVELVCIRGFEEEVSTSSDENRELEFTVFPFELLGMEGSIAKYFLKYFIVGHGLRKIAIRLVPANELIRRSYPELIKWYR
jgi:starch phosphorylase